MSFILKPGYPIFGARFFLLTNMEKEIKTETHVLDEIITFRVPNYVNQQVRAIAGQRQQTVSEYMRGVVKNKLKRQKP